MYSVELLEIAMLDLDEIVEFISYSQNNPDFALKTYDIIKAKIESLADSPKICEPFDFISRNPIYPSPILYTYRKLVVGDYIVLYIVDDNFKKIVVVRVFDGRSDYQNNI